MSTASPAIQPASLMSCGYTSRDVAAFKFTPAAPTFPRMPTLPKPSRVLTMTMLSADSDGACGASRVSVPETTSQCVVQTKKWGKLPACHQQITASWKLTPLPLPQHLAWTPH